MWGSVNWSNASLTNVERCAIATLSDEALATEKKWFDDWWKESRDFLGREAQAMLITPQKDRADLRTSAAALFWSCRQFRPPIKLDWEL